jgi:ketosteroid isomerase-like protein
MTIPNNRRKIMELNTTQPVKETQYNSSDAEFQIRKLIDDFKQAMASQNIEAIMSFYAPDVVAFDIVAPIQYIGAAAYKKSWEKAFADYGASGNESGFEIHNLEIEANENLAFSHSLSHCFGKMKDGKDMDMWMRNTACYKKINGKWSIIHEQLSVPIDFETGKALLDLKPEKNQLH